MKHFTAVSFLFTNFPKSVGPENIDKTDLKMHTVNPAQRAILITASSRPAVATDILSQREGLLLYDT